MNWKKSKRRIKGIREMKERIDAANDGWNKRRLGKIYYKYIN